MNVLEHVAIFLRRDKQTSGELSFIAIKHLSVYPTLNSCDLQGQTLPKTLKSEDAF